MFQKEIVEAQCSNAVDIANKKVKEMRQVKEIQSKKAKHAVDPKVYSQAESQGKILSFILFYLISFCRGKLSNCSFYENTLLYN